MMRAQREIAFEIRSAAIAGGLEAVRAALEGEPGVIAARLDPAGHRLHLAFDAHTASLVQLQERARGLGAVLQPEFERHTLRLAEPPGSESALRLERALWGHPRVSRVSGSAAAGTVTVEHEASDDVRAFLGRLEALGYSAPAPARSKRESRADRQQEVTARRRGAALVALCLVALVAGWLAERFRLLHPALALYAVCYLAGGLQTARRAWNELKARTISIDLLMVVAAAGAAVVGEWPEGGVLLFLFSLSSLLEQYVLGHTRRAIEKLMDLSPDNALVRRGGIEQRLGVEELRPGDIIIVGPGERIAADGVIRLGSTSVNQAAMTGESEPVDKQVGDSVFAATLNQQGAIEIEVTRLASESALARIIQLVEQAQSEKAASQVFTDWFGARYTVAVLGGALVALIVPVAFLHESFSAALYRAMTMLVAASPCAVVISIPAAILSAIAGAARRGVLFKGGSHLEQAARLRAIAFDKTGTLTLGRPRVAEVYAAQGIAPDEVVRLAAAAEQRSEHPLAHAVVEASLERGLALPVPSELEAIVGSGLRAKVEGRSIWVGKPALFAARNCPMPAELAAAADRLGAEGKTLVLVGNDQALLGLLAVADTLRPGSAEAIDRLKTLGLERLLMLTGDHRAVAQTIAQTLGLDFQAELLPEDKLHAVRALRAQYQTVAMVGDGINDAPALAAANLAVSLGGSGTDVALENADVVLMGDDLRLLPDAITLARNAQRIIRQNLVFAFSVMAVLVALTLLESIRLPLAVVGHEGSTVLVILNGLRLFRSAWAGRARGGRSHEGAPAGRDFAPPNPPPEPQPTSAADSPGGGPHLSLPAH